MSRWLHRFCRLFERQNPYRYCNVWDQCGQQYSATQKSEIPQLIGPLIRGKLYSHVLIPATQSAPTKDGRNMAITVLQAYGLTLSQGCERLLVRRRAGSSQYPVASKMQVLAYQWYRPAQYCTVPGTVQYCTILSLRKYSIHTGSYSNDPISWSSSPPPGACLRPCPLDR